MESHGTLTLSVLGHIVWGPMEVTTALFEFGLDLELVGYALMFIGHRYFGDSGGDLRLKAR